MSDTRYAPCMDFLRPIEAVIPSAQGRLLAALARVEEPMNLRTLARVSKVSPAQASRVLPQMVDLGLVKRTEVPPAALFELERGHLAAKLVLNLAASQDQVLREMKSLAERISPAPDSLVVFGSFARGEARAESDLDVLVVRDLETPEDDETWRTSVQRWVREVRTLTGNDVTLLEFDSNEIARRLISRRAIWRSLAHDAIVVLGRSVGELSRRGSA